MKRLQAPGRTLGRMQRFYQTHRGLVTSPFINRDGIVENGLIEKAFRTLSLPVDGSPVLDVGCGSGGLADFFARRGTDYTGLDINVQPEFAGRVSPSVRFVKGSALALPFRDGRFDLVVCVDSYEHYPDPVQAASEMRRVLRPGGRVFLSVPNYSNVAGWVKRRMEASGRYALNTWAPFDAWEPQELEHFMTPRLVRSAFGKAGFSSFRMMGLSNELHFGLLPWLLHPACPHPLKRGAGLLARLVQEPLTRWRPEWRLHTLWAIA